MFVLTKQEFINLRSQIATSSSTWGGTRVQPMAFTEHGTIMAANVLNSPTAVQASIQVVRTFVRLREILAKHKDLAGKLKKMEEKYDSQFKVVFDAIRELMRPVEPRRKKIGFHQW